MKSPIRMIAHLIGKHPKQLRSRVLLSEQLQKQQQQRNMLEEQDEDILEAMQNEIVPLSFGVGK